jgi:YggT family protein
MPEPLFFLQFSSRGGTPMNFLAQTIEILLTIYIWMIIIRAVLSWVGPTSRIPIANYLVRLTDPFLWKIRQCLPLPRLAVDLSPVIAILVLMLIRYLALALLT